MDELLPGSRALYEILVSPTREEYEARLHDYLNASAHNSSSSAPETKRAWTPSLHASSSSAKDGVAPEARLIHDCLDGGSAATAPEAVDVNEQGAASISSPTHPTSAAAAAATASTCISAAAPLDSTSDFVLSSSTATAPTTSAGSHHVLGLTCQTTKDDLTPGARRIYELLVGGSAAPNSTASEASAVLLNPAAFDVAHIAVDSNATDLPASVPINCSMECPSHDESAYAAALTSSPTTNSSMTTGGIVLELAPPELCDKAFVVDDMGDTLPLAAIGLPCSDHSFSKEDHMSVALTTLDVHTVLAVLPRASPRPPLVPLNVPELCTQPPTICSTNCSCSSINTPPSLLAEAFSVFSEVSTERVPWPPPSCTDARLSLIQGHDLFHNAQQKYCKGFSAQDTKSNWHASCLDVELKPPWPSLCACTNLPLGNLSNLFDSISVNDNSSPCASWRLDDVLWKLPKGWPDPPWPPLSSNRSISCRILHQHSALNNMQLSSNCRVLETWKLSYNTVHIMVTSVPGVEEAQLESTMFKWSDNCCFGLQFLGASTLDFSLARRAERTVWNWCYPNNLHCFLRSTNWTLEEEQGQVLRMSWQLFRYNWEAAYPMQPCSAIQGHCFQYEHLQQWRPPDQTTKFLGVQLRLDSKKMEGVTSMKENFPALILQVYNKPCRLTRYQFLEDLFVIEQWLIPWEPGDDSLGHNLMEKFPSLAITCELHYLISVLDSLLRYGVWCMRCLQFFIDKPSKCVIFLQPKPPWSYFRETSFVGVAESLHILSVFLEFNQFGMAPSHGSMTYVCLDFERKLMGHQFYQPLGVLCSCVQLVTESATYFDSQYFEWQIPWYNCDKEFPEAFFLTAHHSFKALHFSWDRGACFASAGSQDNLGRLDDVSYCTRIDISYINTSTCWQWMISWENASSNDGILTCIKEC